MRLSPFVLGLIASTSIALSTSSLAQETPAQGGPTSPPLEVPVESDNPDVVRAPMIVPLPPGQFVATPDEVALAEERLFTALPDDIEEYFDLFLYVSKATSGSLAQRMFIFERGVDARVHPTVQWLVSTGRERREKYFTTTPEGIYKLDIDRMHRNWWSRRWNAPMPFAIFFDYTVKTGKAGLAVHATPQHIDELGTRASGGCVRLHPDHARALFQRMEDPSARGLVPVFPFKPELGRSARDGEVLRNKDGAVVLQVGLKVLLFVENFDGAPEVYAPVVAVLAAVEAVGG
jgi:hypothetical protein